MGGRSDEKPAGWRAAHRGHLDDEHQFEHEGVAVHQHPSARRARHRRCQTYQPRTPVRGRTDQKNKKAPQGAKHTESPNGEQEHPSALLRAGEQNGTAGRLSRHDRGTVPALARRQGRRCFVAPYGELSMTATGRIHAFCVADKMQPTQSRSPPKAGDRC